MKERQRQTDRQAGRQTDRQTDRERQTDRQIDRHKERCPYPVIDRLVGGKAPTSRAEGPGFESRLRRDFFGVESYQ